MPISEAKWNQAIFDWFFGDHALGRPVYLALDSVALRAIAERQGWDGQTARDDFVRCMRTYSSPDNAFGMWVHPARSWWEAGAHGTPPFVHALGLSVLPSTERLPSEEGSYYPSVRRVLGFGGKGVLPGYKEDVPLLWGLLRQWLVREQGKFGLPSASASGKSWEHVGWSLSQALIRAEDRSAFVQFFQQCGYLPGEKVEGKLLLARFERWTSTLPPRARIEKALSDVRSREALCEILRHDLETWKGEVRDSEFRKVVRVRPRITADQRLTSVVNRTPEMPGVRDVSGNWLVDPDDGEQVVNISISLRNSEATVHSSVGGVTFEFRNSRIHAMQGNDVVGGWVGVDRLSEFFESRLLVHTSLSEVRSFLDSSGLRFKEWPGLPGWLIYQDVLLNPQQRSRTPLALRFLLPAIGQRALLVGGLPLGHNGYLIGGAPDLVVPPAPLDLEIKLGKAVLFRLAADESIRLPLNEHLVDPGKYFIEVGDQILEVELLEHQIPAMKRAGAIAQVLSADPPTHLACGRWVADDEVVLSGGWLKSRAGGAEFSMDSVSLATEGYLLVGPAGEFKWCRQSPSWLSDIEQQPCHVRVDELHAEVDFCLDWVGRVFRNRIEVLRLSDLQSKESIECDRLGDRAVFVRGRGNVEAWKVTVSNSPLVVGNSVGVRGPSARLPTKPARRGPTLTEDRLLTWCSERGIGDLESFLSTSEWLTQAGSAESIRKESFRRLTTLSRLGHVEIDWPGRRWAVTPTCVIVPSRAGGLAFLVGARDGVLMKALRDIGSSDEFDLTVQLVVQPAGFGPRSIFLRTGTRYELQRACDSLGVPVFEDTAHSLSQFLPSLDKQVTVGRIPPGFESREGIERSGKVEFAAESGSAASGVFEHDTFGPKLYSVTNNAPPLRTYLIDRNVAVWHVLRQSNRCPISYRDHSRELVVLGSARLPLLHERAVILCTGLLPVFDTSSKSNIYNNVPKKLYEIIRTALS